MKFLTAMLAAVVLAGQAWAYSGEQFVTCNLDPNGDNWVALKAAPDLGSKRMMKLGPRTFLISLEPYEVRGWREVIVQAGPDDWTYAGPQGWVYARYICRTNS